MKLLLVFLLALSTLVFAQDIPIPTIPIGSHPVPVGERVTTQHPLTLTEVGAVFVKVYFEPIGQAQITVRNADSSESYTYSPTKMGKHTKHANGSWAALSVNGDTAVVEVRRGSVMVTHVDYGLAEPVVPEIICGVDNREWVACYTGEVRDRARIVARIHMEGGGLCTAWRVGPGNKMITNQHCVSTQEGVAGMEVWFDYEYTDCAGTQPKTPIKMVGGQFLQTSAPYDYTLFTVQGSEAELQPFGYAGLDPVLATKGYPIYMAGHPKALRKQVIKKDDLTESGQCEIGSTTASSGRDYGYFCDSEGGQSGSPVFSGLNHRVVALHHIGACMNQGVKMAGIWPEIASFFGGTPPVGDNETPATGPTAVMSFTCVENVCQYNAAGSTGATSYQWDFADGTGSDQISGEKTYTVSASYTVRLYVSDGTNGNSAQQTVWVAVPGYNFPPEPRFTAVDEGNLVAYFTSQSFDPDGTVVAYSWRVNESGVWSYYNTPEFRHTFQTSGDKYTDLNVRDNEGAQSKTLFKTVTIAEPPPPPPVCGDGVCDRETWQTCPADCPAPIVLKYTAKKVQGPKYLVTLSWINAAGEQVKLYKAGVATDTANDGTEQFNMHKRDSGLQVKVCDATKCSSIVRIYL